MPRPRRTNPAFLDNARAFYADAFEHKKRRELARSVAEWAEMEPGEQSFAVAHLLYLNLHAQASTQRLLAQIRDLLDEVLDEIAPDEPTPPDDVAVDQDPDGVSVEDGPADVVPAEVVAPDVVEVDDVEREVA